MVLGNLPLVLISKTSAGRDVAADVEVHDITGETAVFPTTIRALHACVGFIMDVVRPREFQRAAVRLQRHPRDGHHQPFSFHAIGDFRDFFAAIAVAREALQNSVIGRWSRLVDDVIITVPTSSVLRAVDVQRHPQGIGIGRDGIRAFHHEIDECVVPRDLRADDVVAA